jgi:hypothetical protein
MKVGAHPQQRPHTTFAVDACVLDLHVLHLLQNVVVAQ